MRAKGVSNYLLELRQAPPRYFIQNYLEFGILKEYRLIENNLKLGREERVFKLDKKFSEVNEIKKTLINLFTSISESNNKIPFMNQGEYEEISFVLGINGSTKTFYIKNKQKIRASINVSELLEFQNGEPTNDSLIEVSLSIIKNAS